jgi:L-asparagine transporter-like permease
MQFPVWQFLLGIITYFSSRLFRTFDQGTEESENVKFKNLPKLLSIALTKIFLISIFLLMLVDVQSTRLLSALLTVTIILSDARYQSKFLNNVVLNWVGRHSLLVNICIIHTFYLHF